MQQLETFASEASIIVHYYTLLLCTLFITHLQCSITEKSLMSHNELTLNSTALTDSSVTITTVGRYATLDSTGKISSAAV